MIRTKFCGVPVDDLFSNESFTSITRSKDNLEQIMQQNHDDEHDHAHPDEDIQYFVFDFNESEKFIHKELEQNIAIMLWEKPDKINVMRCKGLVSLADSDKKYSLQGYFVFEKVI
jgi:G3E family GTPase